MKTCKTIFLALLMLLMMIGTGMASDYQGYPTVTLLIDGKSIQSDVPPIIIDNRTLVPLRVIAENLGATVQYDEQLNYAVISSGTGNQPAAVASQVSGEYQGLPKVGVLVNGQVLYGDVPSVILNGRTMVPLRLVAQALGCTVDYNNGEVSIASPRMNPANTTSSLDDSLTNSIQNDIDTPFNDLTGEADAANDIDNVLNYMDQNINIDM